MNDDWILLKDVPQSLNDSVAQTILFYTIAFLQPPDVQPYGDLLGSGVLVRAGDRHAILTADHVAERLPTAGRIGLFLDRTIQPHNIDAAGISIHRIARGPDKSKGPDLAAVILAPSIASSIGAKKSFFNLDVHKEQTLSRPLDIKDGAWFVQGFVAERTTVKADHVADGLTKYLYNFTGAGGTDIVETVDEYDYFDFPVAHESRPNAPVSFGGMSGGGIWQVPIKRTNGQMTHKKPILSGILFYQHPTTDTQCGVRGHGRRSVYDKAYGAIG